MIKHILSTVLLCALLVWAIHGLAQQSGGAFTLERSTIDSGGGVSTGGEFKVRGTIGQVDTDTSSGGPYELNAGFWAPSSSDLLFKDSYER